MVGGLRNVITCAKFQIEIFIGYDFTGGRIFDFCIDFSMGLTTVQRYCAACDEQTRKALLCHVCRHCCVHGQWLSDMQKPNTHGAASVPIKFRLTISVNLARNLTSNVMLCEIL